MGNSVSTSYPEVWSRITAVNFDAASVAASECNRSVEADLKEYGDTVHVARYGNVTVRSLTDSVDITVDAVAVTDDTLVLDQQKYFNFHITTLERAQTKLDLMKGFMKRAAVAMAQTMDTRIFTHYSDATGGVMGSTTAPITLTPDSVYAEFVEARRLLNAANALNTDSADNGEDGPVALIDVNTEAIILRSPDFIKSTATGDSVIRNGEIGRLAGFRVKVSNRITAVSGTIPLMFFTRDFISLAVRISPQNMEMYKPEKRFAMGCKGLMFYGTKVFNPLAGVTLYRQTTS